MTSEVRISRPYVYIYVGLFQGRQCSSVNRFTRGGQHIPKAMTIKNQS